MKLQITTKFSLFRLKADVKDERGEVIYKLRGRFLSPTHVLHVYDGDNKKRFKIRNKFFHAPFTRTAIIYDENGDRLARIRQKFSMLSNYDVLDNACDLRLDGNVIGWNFGVYKGAEYVGSITAKFSMFGSYEISLTKDDDAEFILAVFAAVTNLRHEKKR